MVEQGLGVCCGRFKNSVIAGVMEMGRKKAKKSLQKIHDRGASSSIGTGCSPSFPSVKCIGTVIPVNIEVDKVLFR